MGAGFRDGPRLWCHAFANNGGGQHQLDTIHPIHGRLPKQGKGVLLARGLLRARDIPYLAWSRVSYPVPHALVGREKASGVWPPPSKWHAAIILILAVLPYDMHGYLKLYLFVACELGGSCLFPSGIDPIRKYCLEVACVV